MSYRPEEKEDIKFHSLLLSLKKKCHKRKKISIESGNNLSGKTSIQFLICLRLANKLSQRLRGKQRQRKQIREIEKEARSLQKQILPCSLQVFGNLEYFLPQKLSKHHKKSQKSSRNQSNSKLRRLRDKKMVISLTMFLESIDSLRILNNKRLITERKTQKKSTNPVQLPNPKYNTLKVLYLKRKKQLSM